MGILDRFRLRHGILDQVRGGTIELGASPWAEGSLAPFVIDDLLPGATTLPLTRQAAMGIPAVAKARNLLVSTVMQFPLVDMVGAARAAAQPEFLWRTNQGVSPSDRMAWTIDDCIFYGLSVWAVERDASGNITEGAWVMRDRWEIIDDELTIDGQIVPESSYLLFNPPFDGLLQTATTSLAGARDIEKAWTQAVVNPIPLVEFSITSDDIRMSQHDLDGWLDSWRGKHSGKDGRVGATPYGVELKDHGQSEPQLYVEARNAMRTDIGSFLNVRASMLDGTMGIDSLTYTTTAGERNAFYEFDLPFWTKPIEDRLSLDDVVPAGHRVRFDKYNEYGEPIATDVPTAD